MEHDAVSSRRYKENWDDCIQANRRDAAELAECKEAYALLFKELANERRDLERLDRFETWLADRAGPLLHIDQIKEALK